MAKVHDKQVKEKTPKQNPEEQDLIGKLFELVEVKNNSWRQAFNNQMLECYDFAELRQWNGGDMQLLAMSGTPTLSIDRIGRGIDIINGIKTNTGNKKKITPREAGDERIAKLLDLTYDWVSYNGNFDDSRNEAFDSMLKCGIGIRKLGLDPTRGDGELWSEFVPIEDFGYSRCKSKELDDCSWVWQRQMMSWEDAMMINPEKAGEIKGMKTIITAEWDKLKASNVKGSFAQDYSNLVVVENESRIYYPDMVYIWEFWLKNRKAYRRVGSMIQQEDPQSDMPIMTPQIRVEEVDYKIQEDEQDLGVGIEVSWEQYIVATGNGKKNGILLKQGTSKFPFHPYTATCAERKKSGQPIGYVERCLPHQKRKNIAWSQKVAYNNKAIKSPLIGYNIENIEQKMQATQLGTMLLLNNNEKIQEINVQPQVNLYALEESAAADRDMDFAAGATEPVMRGESSPSTSGIKLSLQQSAAITPMNKWVSADSRSELSFARKILYMIISEFSQDKIRRILGDRVYVETLLGKIDPMTGMNEPMPQYDASTASYDVIIEDVSISDFNKQQTFNASMALQGLHPYGMFTDDWLIKSAPIKNVDSALISNEKVRTDVIQQQQQMIQMLQGQLEITQKLIPKQPNQAKNAVTGKTQSQAGQNSMLGGARGT
jgi:hypothetical protein